jgi:DNA-binding NarL/FixJ family response regulator
MRLFIVDDHRLFAESLANLLSSIDGFEVIGTAVNGSEAMEWLKNNKTDVILSDLRMPEMTGAGLTFRIRESYPQIKILIISMEENAEQIAEVIQAGAHGFLQKNASKTELQTAIKTISHGEMYFSQAVMRILTKPKNSSAEGYNISELKAISEREIAVLKLIANEFTTQGIADKLFVSVNTIESHRKNLIQKLGVKNAMGLVRYAIRNGLIEA